MTFDSTISKDVSLSKVLDAFILDDESPSIIVAFLKQHDDAFADILQYSFYCNRLFQLDFFLKCGEDEQQYIITKLKDVNIYDAAMLTWQVLKSNSGKVQHVKYRLRKELKWILENGPRHPYGYHHEAFIGQLDDVCFKLAESDQIHELPTIVKPERLNTFFQYLSYSLFQDRLLQYDFFANLNDVGKHVFCYNVFGSCKPSSLKRLALQILDSDEIPEVKELCFNSMYQQFVPTDILDEKTLDLVIKCKSFPELMLKMTIFNTDVSQYIALYLLLFKPKWIKEWVEYDKDNLNMNLNISELSEYLSKKGHK